MERYDVFISFKNTDNNGHPTRDARMAENLYRALKQKGISTFFSKYSINESARADYVDAIDNALESASVFVAVGTCKEHLTSGWVKHEINQFRTMLNEDGDKPRSIFSYRSEDFSPNDLPSGLRCYQSHHDLNSVVRFVEACLQKASGFRSYDDGTVLLYENNPTSPLTPNVPFSTPPAAEHHGLQIDSVLDDRYHILALIGRGGMSKVYLATDKRLNKTCAVKELHCKDPKNFEVILQSLRTEADLMQKLDHPAVAKIYDVITLDDSFIIVMEYVDGRPLNSLLSERGPFSEEQVLDFARQLCQVLDHLHTRPTPIIYRDMKPANIMLKSNGTLKLLDFGTAREYKESNLEDTTCLGTVGFAAPEQFGGMGQTDARTDIYNLGVTLYYLVTGKNPAEPPYEILPIRQVNPKLSRALERIILKCTQKDPDNRFRSAKELLQAVDKASKKSPLASLFKRSAPPQPQKRKPQAAAAPFAIPGYHAPVTPAAGFSVPAVKPVVSPAPVINPVPPAPAVSATAPPTEPLNIIVPSVPVAPVPGPVFPKPTPAPTAPEKPTARKVTVRPKAPGKTNPEMDEIITKLTALDPQSQQLVYDLIKRLSK